MTDFDNKIRAALTQQDAGMRLDLDDQPGIFETLTDTFRGRWRAFNILGVVVTLVFLGLGVAAGVAFFSAQAVREQIMWAGAVMFCLAAVSMLKIWFWMEMQRIALMREIKRVELQVARLAAGARAESPARA